MRLLLNLLNIFLFSVEISLVYGAAFVNIGIKSNHFFSIFHKMIRNICFHIFSLFPFCTFITKLINFSNEFMTQISGF